MAISKLAGEATNVSRFWKRCPIANKSRLRFGRHTIPLPSWKPLRIALGIGFLIGGVFSILPVLGLWMLPVGVLILSVDIPAVRRLRRRIDSWYGRSRFRRFVSGLWRRASKD